MQGWFTSTPSVPEPTVRGWFDAPGVEVPPVDELGWWVGLATETGLTIQFLTYAELQSLRILNLVLAASMDRTVVLEAVRTIALSLNLTVTMDLGMNGIYFLDSATALSFTPTSTLRTVRDIEGIQRVVNLNRTATLGNVLELSALQSIWTLNRSLGLTKILTVDLARTVTWNRPATLTKIQTMDLSLSVSVNRAAAMGFPPWAGSSDTFTAVGAYAYDIPRQATYIDVILLGAGSGGMGGNFFNDGGGGHPGSWTTVTLERGVDIPWSTLQITGSVGDGSNPVSGGNESAQAGHATATGTGMTSLQGTGGAGNNAFGFRTATGPGNVTYNGVTYVGGANTTSGVGNPPGCGGAGGPQNGSAAKGAPGQVWFKAYQ